MNKAEIKKRIYLTGNRLDGYQVIHKISRSTIDCWVWKIKTGNAIVRALRELAYQDNAK